MPPSLPEIRAQFPGLDQPTVLLDNAGGAQLPRCVIDATRDYMTRSYVQLGADYDISRRATDTVRCAHAFAKVLVNAADDHDASPGRGSGEVALGPSSSVLCIMLANAYADALAAGTLPTGRTEIVVCTAGHEANIGPWMRLASRGFTIREWPATQDHSPEGGGAWRILPSTLAPLLSPRTALVAFPHVSNVLGEIVDLGEVCRLAHAVGARVVADGVAFAPHRAIDIRASNVDWYVFSLYKVYGPHMAALYGRRDAFAELTGPNHYFIGKDDIPYKFEPGGVSHEAAAAFNALWDYLCFLAGETPPDTGGISAPRRPVIERAFARMAALERPLQERLLGYLSRKPGVTIAGTADAGENRVPTIAFTREGRSSAAIARAANARALGFRYGHFYSKRLIEQMKLHPDEGAVRISLVHYNSPGEVDRLIETLDALL